MGLNPSKGNMYEFVTHTWNVIKGKCPHDCSYCYMKRWGEQRPVRFDESELKTDLGKDNFIFVGSSNDMFSNDMSLKWTQMVIDHCNMFDNKYLLQTKNPAKYLKFDLDKKFILGCTIESDVMHSCMGKTPEPFLRARALRDITNKKFITIEPVLDFNIDYFAGIIHLAKPDWVNIGADSGNNKLPEPPKEKVDELIKRIDSKITIKKNMKRLDSKDK